MLRRLAWTVLAVTLVALVAGALYPFRFDPPRTRTNQVQRLADGVLRFGQHNVARTETTPAFMAVARATASMRVELELRAALPTQYGPARVFALSQHPKSAVLTIGHDETDLVVRVRRPQSTESGSPALRDREHHDEPGWRRVSVRLAPTRIVVEADGRVAAQEVLPPGYTTTWAEDVQLALGDEPTGARAWQGELRRARVEVSGTTFDCLRDGALHIPERAFFIPERLLYTDRLFRDHPLVILAHFGSFLTLGAALVFLLAPAARLRNVLLIGAGIAVWLQLAKTAFADRHVCFLDVPAQVLGAWVGTEVTRKWVGWRSRPRPGGRRPREP